MKHYMVIASLHLRTPVAGDGSEDLDAAYQNFGVLANSVARARELVSSAVRDAEIDWEDSEVRTLTLEELRDPDFTGNSQAKPDSVWYRSGRVFYAVQAE